MRGARDHEDNGRGWGWHEMNLETLAGPNEASSILAVCSNHPSLAESESFGIGPAGVLPAVLT